MDTQALRTHIKTQRAALDRLAIEQASRTIASRLYASEEFIQAQHVAYYLPISGEADPTYLLELTHKENNNAAMENRASIAKRFYLPVIKQQGGIGLDFIEVNENTVFTTNLYGITEPILSPSTANRTATSIRAEELDLVITPLVSFDQHLNRIGMGGGYYDRTFAFKKNSPNAKPLLIGYAYEFQRSEALIAETWDVSLDGVVTENGFIR